MVIAMCLDEKFGMMFNGRRQSKDRALRQRLLTLANGKCLRMDVYSQKQFEWLPDSTYVGEDFLQTAGDSDICFVENPAYMDQPESVDKVILYCWNRHYPADQFLPERFLEHFLLTHTCDFVGNSHDVITEKIYEKK